MVAVPVALSLSSLPANAAEKVKPYQKFADQCINDTQKKLAKMDLKPSEESSEYDEKFEDFFEECMAAKGVPTSGDGQEIPFDRGDEGLPPEEVTE